MADEVLSISLEADISALRTALAEMPDVGKREAAAMVKGMIREYNKSEKAAQKLARETKKAAKQAAKGWTDAFKIVGTQISARLVKDVVMAVASMKQEISDFRNDILDMSTQTGIAADTINGLRAAVEASGGSLTELRGGLSGLAKRIEDFGQGTGEARIALEALGFSAEDSDALLADMDGTTKLLLTRLRGVESEGKRAALAQELFGESSSRLLQVLGDQSLERWVAQASLSVDISGEAAEESADWAREMSGLKDAILGAKGRLADFLVTSEDLRTMTDAVIGARATWDSFKWALDSVAESMEPVTASLRIQEKLLRTISTAPIELLKLAYENFAGTGERVRDVVESQADAAAKLDEEWGGLVHTMADYNEMAEALGVPTEFVEKQTKKLATAAENAADALEKIGLDRASDAFTAEEAVRSEYRQTLLTIQELASTADGLTAESLQVRQQAAAATREAEQRLARDLVEIRRQAVEEVADATAELEKMAFERASDTLSAEGVVRAEYAKTLAAIQELASQSEELSVEATIARHQAEERLARDLAELHEAEAQSLRESLDEAAQSFRETAAAADEAFAELHEQGVQRIVETGDTALSVVGSVSEVIEALSSQRLSRLEEEAEAEVAAAEQAAAAYSSTHRARVDQALERGKIDKKEAARRLVEIRTEEQRQEKKIERLRKKEAEAAKKSWRWQQTAAVAGAIVDAARSAMALIPSFLFMGPFAPLGAASAAGAALTIQLAAISNAKPPEFPAGGMVGRSATPDHVVIGARMDEAVLTGRGVDNAGGPAGVDALNQGQTGGPTHIALQIGRRVVAEAVIDVITGGEVTAALDARTGRVAGQAPLYQR